MRVRALSLGGREYFRSVGRVDASDGNAHSCDAERRDRVDPRASTAAVVAFIAAQPGGAERLMTIHAPNESGRCRGCTFPGTGTPHGVWPCPLHHWAVAAASLITASTVGRGHANGK